jgi:hypothetical protein
MAERRTIKVKPAVETDPDTGKPLIVRDPDNRGRPIPKEGRVVEDTPYWRNRLRDGSVVLMEARKKTVRDGGGKKGSGGGGASRTGEPSVTSGGERKSEPGATGMTKERR